MTNGVEYDQLVKFHRLIRIYPVSSGQTEPFHGMELFKYSGKTALFISSNLKVVVVYVSVSKVYGWNLHGRRSLVYDGRVLEHEPCREKIFLGILRPVTIEISS